MEPGARHKFVGPSGAGKNSTIKIMSRLLEAEEGRITINGMDARADLRKLKAMIGYVLGGEVKISTIYGDVICKIKAGTQSGSQIRLKGKGIVASGNPAVHGDQYVTVEVQVPKNLTPEAKQKLKEFEQLCNEAGKSTHGGYAA